MRDVSSWSWTQQHRYFMARFCYAHRWEICPRPVEIDGEVRPITWATWFHRAFGVTLDEYQQQLQETSDAPEQAASESR